MIDATLGRLTAGEDLSMEDMAAAIAAIMEGRCDDGQIGLLLTALRAKGETHEEVAGAASALRQHMVKIRCPHKVFVDTCGTGGDGSNTFNISTAAAIVTAAAGVPVAKHGNRRISSRSGSSDVLTALGVNVEADVDRVEACLAELGICFCFAPLMHPAMKHVAEVRKKLGVPTIFNMLGPLANPASAPIQLLGVGRDELRPLLAGALLHLGVHRALVVCGRDGLDEVTLSGPTDVTEVTDESLREYTWTPENFGIAAAPLDTLCVAGAEESAQIIRDLLDGQPGPARDIVILNAAAALVAADAVDSPQAGAQRAAAAIDSGDARYLLTKLAQLSHA